MRVVRVYVPGARRIGGTWVALRADLAHDTFERSGVLAEPARVRGVLLPEGTRIHVDPDFDDIGVELRSALRVRGVDLPAGTRLTFRGRVLGFAGLRLTLSVAVRWLPHAWLDRRRRDLLLEIVAPCSLHQNDVEHPAGTRLCMASDGTLTRADA